MTQGERLEALALHAIKRLQRATAKAKAARDELSNAGKALDAATAALVAYREANPVDPGNLF